MDEKSLQTKKENLQHQIQQQLQSSRDAIIKAALVTAGVGATVGYMKAIVREIPKGSAALSMGISWGATGLLYFSIRTTLDRWLTPYLPSTTPYTLWYPTSIALVAGASSGTLSMLVVGRPFVHAVKHGSSLAVIAGAVQCGWSGVLRVRQNLLFRELETQRDWQTRWRTCWQQRVASVVAWTQETTWLPIRFISQEEWLDRLAVELAKKQYAMQKYQGVMETLKDRIRELKVVETENEKRSQTGSQ